MDWTDTALVLRVGKFKEADLWVRLLAMREGIVTAFAFGGSKSRRRFTGCLDMFNLILVNFGTSRNGAFINMHEATLLEGPSRLRADWQRQGVAANCLRFLESMGVPPGNASSSFNLMREVLSLLEHAEDIPAITPLLFRFRLASEQGYAPDLSICAFCGQALHKQPYADFIVSEGYAICPDCRSDSHPLKFKMHPQASEMPQPYPDRWMPSEDRPAGRSVPVLPSFLPMALRIDAEALDVLRQVQEYSTDRWSSFKLSSEGWRQASRLIDAFVRYHLGLEWVNGRFIR